MALVLLSPGWVAAGERPLFQELVDATPAGGTLRPAAGVYAGPVTIEKPIAIDGGGVVTIDNGGTGTLIVLKADGITVENLRLINSGDSHDRIDAAIRVESSHNRILHNRIENSLFGIDLKEAHENEIRGNDISSKDVRLGIRGDGMRLWASHRNRVVGNNVHDSRDVVVWYSDGNLFQENRGRNNRYSLHFMYTGANLVRRNDYANNTVGIFLMYSQDIVLEENRIVRSLGATGMGIGLKEVSNMQILRNEVTYCATGIYIDFSPYDDETVDRIEGNVIAYNIRGIMLHSDLEGNEFRGNYVVENLEPVVVQGNGTAVNNLWEGNFWSRYEGFDRDDDGTGDTPYVHYVYFDQLWGQYPKLRFFYGSPVTTFLDFLGRLLPLSEPRLVVQDSAPVFRAAMPAYPRRAE